MSDAFASTYAVIPPETVQRVSRLDTGRRAIDALKSTPLTVNSVTQARKALLAMQDQCAELLAMLPDYERQADAHELPAHMRAMCEALPQPDLTTGERWFLLRARRDADGVVWINYAEPGLDTYARKLLRRGLGITNERPEGVKRFVLNGDGVAAWRWVGGERASA